jgi:hypothetical protein
MQNEAERKAESINYNRHEVESKQAKDCDLLYSPTTMANMNFPPL